MALPFSGCVTLGKLFNILEALWSCVCNTDILIIVDFQTAPDPVRGGQGETKEGGGPIPV